MADGKVFVGSRKGEFFIFRDGTTADLVFRTNLHGEINTACAIANGCLYIMAGPNLFAIQKQ